MVGKRIQREIKTIEKMIQLYEKAHPVPADSPEQYKKLYAYAINRLEKCRYGEQKPACKQCPIHCYQPKMREQMKIVMRWAGPKMLLHHPILAIRHLLDDRKPVPELPERKRNRNSSTDN
ncbi:nitrous oxide-stimulated promoter family protein [Providencia stuartii]|uniref:nitrous oxide-stimulated promoter family protein n=1 Tax=Providencia stuartii TaxID=588 RepID=UPI0013A75D88|nr:nitrous oxide-stimulated promoter family protein [Providencia stuartii]QIB29518.1 nitrous oxide-stimulated promoter family protein [Providencia stuartii]